MDQMVRWLLKDGSARVVCALTTETSQEAARRHGASGGAAVLLSRATTSGLLLTTLAKQGERVTLQVLGNGPLGGVTVDAFDHGDVRAYATHPAAAVPAERMERPQVGWALGRQGVVQVIRELPGGQRYNGQSTITSGEVDEDVEHYLNTSEQTLSALSCDVVLGEELGIGVAGGVLVQALPGGQADALIGSAQAQMREGLVHRVLRGWDGKQDLAAQLAHAAVGAELAEQLDRLDERNVRFTCPCSRERVTRMLSLMSVAELDQLMAEQGCAEITCNFCRENYVIPGEELRAIREARAAAG